MVFDFDKFRKDIASKRLGLTDGDSPLSLRQCSEQAGVSYATLSRLEKGAAPDIFTFATIVGWLGTNANDYFKN